ncbi:hypothetical protein BGY98DRAFT_1011659, partial [Russula aff. rugulosa BPL654]
RGGFAACTMIVADLVALPYSATMSLRMFCIRRRIERLNSVGAPRVDRTSHVHSLRTWKSLERAVTQALSQRRHGDLDAVKLALTKGVSVSPRVGARVA